jgi:hypothetical protein
MELNSAKHLYPIFCPLYFQRHDYQLQINTRSILKNGSIYVGKCKLPAIYFTGKWIARRDVKEFREQIYEIYHAVIINVVANS